MDEPWLKVQAEAAEEREIGKAAEFVRGAVRTGVRQKEGADAYGELRVGGRVVQVKVTIPPLVVLFLLALGAVLALGCRERRGDDVPIRERPTDMVAPMGGDGLVTFDGVVYVPPGTLARYTSPVLLPGDDALLVHERRHAERQRELTWPLWSTRYALDLSFRWGEERDGYERQQARLRDFGLSFDRESLVRIVTDPWYGGMVSREDAEKWADGVLR